jgi:hypothetical protein
MKNAEQGPFEKFDITVREWDIKSKKYVNINNLSKI